MKTLSEQTFGDGGVGKRGLGKNDVLSLASQGSEGKR